MTDFLSATEPCYGIWEGHEDGRWIQKCFVVRGDTIAKFLMDFGPAENFEMTTPIFLPCKGNCSVAEMQAWAERNRHDTYWQTRAKEMLAESTLISDLIEQQEKILSVAANRTTIGPHQRVQRNGFSLQKKFKKAVY